MSAAVEEQRQRFCQASADGKLELVGEILQKEPSLGKDRLVNLPDGNGNIALHYAAAANRIKVVLMLLEHGSDVNHQNNQGDTPAHVAVIKGHDGMVLWLLKKGANLHLKNKTDQSVVQLASPKLTKFINEYNEMQQKVKYDITRARGAQILSVEERDEVLKGVAEGNITPLARYFKQRGPEVLATTDIDGKNLLHVACENNQVGAVDYLLQNGVNPNKEEEYGNTPLITTSADGYDQIVELLIQHHAQLNKMSLFGHTALMLATIQGHEGIVKQLLDAKANPNIRGKKGYTAMHYAVEYYQPAIAALLLAAGADLTIQNNEHRTPLELANQEMKELLLGKKTVAEVVGSGQKLPTTDALALLAQEHPELLIDYKQLAFGSFLGKGAFADVYKGKWAERIVAIKQLRQRGGYSLNVLQRLRNEIAIMRKLQGPNVLELCGVCVAGPTLCVVTKFMAKGSLADVMYRDKQRLSDAQVKKIAVGVSWGLRWVHEQGVIHRDIRSANVLVDDDYEPCIADFGLSCDVSEVANSVKEGDDGVGALRWMAPEAFTRRALTQKADVYSFGMLLWELLAGDVPFSRVSPLQAATAASEQHLRPLIPASAPRAIREVIEAAWRSDPAERPSFAEIHQRLQGAKDP